MEKTLPLYLGPSVIGSVICRIENRHITLSAKTYASLPGICRAYVRGQNGTLLIGVLAPDKSGFSSQKNITSTSLRDHGLSFEEITYAFAMQSEQKTATVTERWQQLDTLPEILLRNNIILTLAKSTGTLANDRTSPTQLAIPLFTGRPFPCPDVLCLLTPQSIGNKLYGIIGISESGTPKRV